MCTTEILSNGKVALNVFTDSGWIQHIFSDHDTLDKYLKKCLEGTEFD